MRLQAEHYKSQSIVSFNYRIMLKAGIYVHYHNLLDWDDHGLNISTCKTYV
jgi:hypothetical protein